MMDTIKRSSLAVGVITRKNDQRQSPMGAVCVAHFSGHAQHTDGVINRFRSSGTVSMRQFTQVNGYRVNQTVTLVTLSHKKSFKDSYNLCGKRFGHCVAVEQIGTNKYGYRVWGCACDCGVLFATSSSCLLGGKTLSCGCQRTSKNKLPAGQASRNRVLENYKAGARARGHEWLLSDDEFFRLAAMDCHYCKSPPRQSLKPIRHANGGFVYSGIDRIDNSVGYIPSNVVPCCGICNRAKGKCSVTEFTEWLRRIASQFGQH